jgi:hypothetical protein
VLAGQAVLGCDIEFRRKNRDSSMSITGVWPEGMGFADRLIEVENPFEKQTTCQTHEYKRIIHASEHAPF